MNTFGIMRHTLEVLDTASTGRQRRMENAPEYTCVCGWRGTKPSFSDATRTRLNRELGMVEIVREHVAVCPLCFAEVERAP